MTANMGTIDRTVRIIVAVLLLAAALFGWVSGILAVLAVVFAVVFIATSIVKVCPLYLPFGIRTLGKPKD